MTENEFMMFSTLELFDEGNVYSLLSTTKLQEVSNAFEAIKLMKASFQRVLYLKDIFRIKNIAQPLRTKHEKVKTKRNENCMTSTGERDPLNCLPKIFIFSPFTF